MGDAPLPRLYGDGTSGNVYKVRLLLALLGRPYEHEPTRPGPATQTPEFRRLNPNGRVPVLVDGDFVLWESNAILRYLAEGSDWWPTEPRRQARALQWMFFEQYSHEPYIAVSRALLLYRSPGPERDRLLAEKRPGCEHALAVMEHRLSRARWFDDASPTVADLALYAYTHRAHEAGLDLGPYPSVRRWLADMRGLPGYVEMDS